MAKSSKKNENNISPPWELPETPLSAMAKQAIQPAQAIHSISLPLSLNDYYNGHIDNLHNCLLFLERFADQDESIQALVDAYKADPNKYSSKFDLDALAEAADLSRGEFRRLINSTLDLLADEEAAMLLRFNKPVLIKKSIEIALTDMHPDSYLERKGLLEYYGIKVVPKGSQVNIISNSGNTQTALIQQQGLPSFSSTIAETEELVQNTMKELIAGSDALEDAPAPKLALVPESEPIEEDDE